jgi:hypothetical protein
MAGRLAAPWTRARQLPSGFIPSPTQRHLRDLTRYRLHLVDERARLTNRLQTVREDATSKLASVVSEVRGLSAREILQRLLDGDTDARALADLARGKLRAKRDALAQAVVGRLEAHHVFRLRLPAARAARSARVAGGGHRARGRRARRAPGR